MKKYPKAAPGMARTALAAALLAGCAAMAPVVTTWNIPAPGSSWQVSQRNTGSYGADRVSEITRGDGSWQGKPVVTLANSAGFTIMAQADGRWSAIVDRDGKPVTVYDPPVGFLYPLKVGKTWTTHHRMTTPATGQVSEFAYSCHVQEFGKVGVPAGSFDAFKVVCSTPGSEDTYWASTELGMFVKSDLKRMSNHQLGAGTQRQELVSLNLRK